MQNSAVMMEIVRFMSFLLLSRRSAGSVPSVFPLHPCARIWRSRPAATPAAWPVAKPMPMTLTDAKATGSALTMRPRRTD